MTHKEVIGNATLYLGDCLDVLKTLPTNSVDSVVCDPPYGLSFMGKKWDYDVPSVDIWAECLRVLKPGGHLLAFAGTRTQHRMACHIEAAGFEIRDMIAWVYGCLDEATEVATESGVMPYHKTKIGDRVLCYDAEHGEYTYQPILEIVEYDYSDTAYRLVGDFGEQVVSRNHRVLVERGGKEAFQLAETLGAEACVPVLESLPALQQAVRRTESKSGFAQQDMQQGVRAWGGHNTSLVRVVPFHYTGKVWCLRVPTGAFVAVRNGVAFPTGNSGFPKSLDVSKAISKRAGGDVVARKAIDFMRARREELGLSRIEFERLIFGRSDGNVRNWEDGISLPKPGLWADIKLAMALDVTPFDADMERGDEEVGRDGGSFGYQKGGERWESERVLRAPATEAARQWQGWGTALKPALEPITMARKPFASTVAANVLEHGTGALNIDGCRVEYEDDCRLLKGGSYGGNRTGAAGTSVFGTGDNEVSYQGGVPEGRWPANLILSDDPEVVAGFPDSNGSGTARVLKRGAKTENNGWGMNTTAADFAHLPDAGTGSAARFFYCAKTSKKDRGEGNVHPTVKPTDLMAYLCRLVTPPGGVVLDPFMGSGSTGKAAIPEGFHFIGVECEPAYFGIACRRIEQAHAQGQLFEPTQAAPVQLGLEAA